MLSALLFSALAVSPTYYELGVPRSSPVFKWDATTGGMGFGQSSVGTGYGIDLFNLSFHVAGTTEQGLYFRYWGTPNGGVAENPLWMLGRIIGNPYGSEFRYIVYSDDAPAEHTVLSIESTGTIASVRRVGQRGSHWEAFIAGDSAPLFRLNSSPQMQLELGPGGSSETDVGWARTAAGIMQLNNGSASNDGATIEFDELGSAPSAPADNRARLYLQDNGAGKEQLCALFNTGATVCFATEP